MDVEYIHMYSISMIVGMFFTTQRLTGADVYVCYDRTLHKFWVVVINSVYKWVKSDVNIYK